MEKPEEEKQNQGHQHFTSPPSWPTEATGAATAQREAIKGLTETRGRAAPVSSRR